MFCVKQEVKLRKLFKPKVNMTDIPMKQTSNAVLHVRVPQEELYTLKSVGADIPEIVRQAIAKAAKQVTTTY